MTVTTSTPQDLLESAARCVEGGSAPANRLVSTAWREWPKGGLASGAHRHFEVFAREMDSIGNTGADTQTTYIDRTMLFGVRLKFKVEGKTALSTDHGAAMRDARSISDRVCRKLREHDTAYASSGGSLVSTALNGVRTVDIEGPITIEDGGDGGTSFYVVMMFRVYFRDTQVTS